MNANQQARVETLKALSPELAKEVLLKLVDLDIRMLQRVEGTLHLIQRNR